MSHGQRLSFWERHEYKFYNYGYVYASIYGLVVIDYVPDRPKKRWLTYMLHIYSHIVSLCLIVALPVYFGCNYAALTETSDRRLRLLLYVAFCNTFIKYITVVLTYIANAVHFTAINQCSRQRQQLEAAFASDYSGPQQPKQHFEFLMYFKFSVINLMIMLQALDAWVLHYNGSNKVRMHFAFYAFLLWNYTENMVNYFYYVNSSALKYYQQLHEQVRAVLREAKLLHYFRLRCQRRGTVLQLCCVLCDRLSVLRARFAQIRALYVDSFVMQQFQLLGIIVTTLLTNLTNSFTTFNLLEQPTPSAVMLPISVNILCALGFYIDTYVVTLVNEHIQQDLQRLALTMRQFSQLPELDVRLDEEVEHFSLLLLHCQRPFAICGFLPFDRRLVFLIATTGFSYFVTLVQFDLNLRYQF